MKFKVLSAALLVGVTFSMAAGVQTQKGAHRAEAKPAPAESAVAQRQRLDALQTLLFLKNSTSEIKDARDQVRVLLEVADAMWAADQEQSREVFRRAFDNAVEYENGLDEKQAKVFGMALRRSVVARVARRDASLADRLLSASVPKETAPATPNESFAKLYGIDSSRGDVLVRAASEMLATDKNAAVQLGQLAAAEGFTQGLRHFLVTLRAKDAAAADAVFEVALQSASRRSPKELVEALFLWDYAFRHGDIYLGQVSWFAEGGSQQPGAPVTPEVKRRALAFAVEAVLENVQRFDLAAAKEEDRPLARERYALIHSLASQILPDVVRFAPAQAELLQTHLSRIDQELRDQGRTPPTPPEPMQTTGDANDDGEKMLNIASRVTNLKVRDGVYARAALTLYMHRQYERALEISNKIDDNTLELELTEPIKFDRAGELLAAKETDAALAVVRTLERPEAKVAALTRLAAAYTAAKNPARAVEILGEAEVLAEKTEPSIEMALASLAVAQGYLAQDRAKAAELAAAAIRVANAVGGDEPWGLLRAGSGADGRLAVENLNWASGRGGIVTSVSVTYPKPAGLLDVLSKLAATDLNESFMLARQLKWKGVSLAAQALVCRETLEGVQKNKGATNKSRARTE